MLENTEAADAVLVQTLRLLEAVKKSSLTVISTPIVFSSSYAEISRSDGMLRAIKETGAFQAGTQGSKLIPQIAEYGDRIIEVSGKRGPMRLRKRRSIKCLNPMELTLSFWLAR